MIIASMIVKTTVDSAEKVVLALNELPNVTTYGIHKDNNIVVLIEAESEDKLRDLSRYINSEFDGVTGTYPTFISVDEELSTQETIVN